MKMDKILGVIGGMGPEAGAQFFYSLVKAKHAKTDQDNIEIFLHNNTKIPDRTNAILGIGPSPVPELLRSAKILQKSGAHFIIVPCITSHYFLDEVQKIISIPIINVVKECVKHVVECYSTIDNIGILATTGTINSQLFNKEFHKFGKIIIYPTEREQEKNVMRAIYGPNGIKAGNTGSKPKKLIVDIVNKLIKRGAQCIVAGCTEIPLVISQRDFDIPIINPMEQAINIALKKCSK
jgi:aspartate racemase